MCAQDRRRLIPAPTNTPEDAGPYITLGMCYASNPQTGESDVTIHRMCIQSRDELSIFLQPGARHIGYFRELAEAKGLSVERTVYVEDLPAWLIDEPRSMILRFAARIAS